MAVSGTVDCLSVDVCFTSPNVHSVVCAMWTIYEPAQLFLAGFWVLLMPYHYFVLSPLPTILSLTTHPPNVSIPDAISLFQPAILFGGNFYKQPLVLGKLLNTVKWSIFCVSFIYALTILGWLLWFKIFKIDHLITSNVQFGIVSQNPVTHDDWFAYVQSHAH